MTDEDNLLGSHATTWLDLQLPWCGQIVIYPYSILNSTPNFHSYFTLRCFQCLQIPYSDISDVFWCFPYSDVFLFCTPMFLMFPAVFQRLSALWCFPYSDVSEILLFHSIPSPCSDIFQCFPHFYRCGTFSELLWAHYHHGTFSVTSQTIFPKHHNLGSIMDSLWMQ